MLQQQTSWLNGSLLFKIMGYADVNIGWRKNTLQLVNKYLGYLFSITLLLLCDAEQDQVEKKKASRKE